MSAEVLRDEAEVKEKWRDADKLMWFGFKAAKYLKVDGTLDEDKYLENFKLEEDERGYHIGELNVPRELAEGDFSGETVGLVIADFGLGHRREEDAYRKLMRVLKIGVKTVDLAELKEDAPMAVRIIAGFQERYQRVSHAEGYKNGTAHREVYFDKSKVDPLINLALDTWERLDHDGYHKSILGKPDESFTEEKVKQRMDMLDRIFGDGLRKYIRSMGVTRNMILWPMIKKGFVGPTVVLPSDAVVDPRGWRSEYLTVVEMELARRRFIDIYDGEVEDKIVYFNGFPAQLGGITRVEELSKIRAEKMIQGEPLTVVLTASGAATVQKRFFVETMSDLAELIAAGKLRMVIQCGYGDLGRQVEEAVRELAEEMDQKHPGFQNGFVSHYAESAQGAVDFGEVLSSGECPVVFLGKGGEWTRMLLQVGGPHIVPVAIGDQENWNIITACMQDTCIYLLPVALEQVSRFIDEFPGFPEEMKRSAHLAINRHGVGDLRSGLEMVAWAIKEQRTIAETNRQAMCEVIKMLMEME